MKREFSAGGVVFRKQIAKSKMQKYGILFLLRRASGGEEYRGTLGWTLPKGWIDEGETVEQAAVRETREEAGVEAKITGKLETIKYFYKDTEGEKVMKFVTYYLMEWVSDLPGGYGWETAEVAWMDGETAIKNLAYASEKKLIKKAMETKYA